MSVEADDRLWIQRDMLATDTEQPAAEQYFYDVANERVFIKARMLPVDRQLTVQDVEQARVQYFGLDPVGLSRESQESKDQISVREIDLGKSLFLSSSLQRSIGSDSLKQPFGTLTLRTVIDETTYEEVKGHVTAKRFGPLVIRGKEAPIHVYEIKAKGDGSASNENLQ